MGGGGGLQPIFVNSILPIARTCYFHNLGVGIANCFAIFCLFLPIFEILGVGIARSA